MLYSPLKNLVVGIMIGIVVTSLSNDYIIIRRSKYDRLKRKADL
jgi:hypothetical protein